MILILFTALILIFTRNEPAQAGADRINVFKN